MCLAIRIHYLLSETWPLVEQDSGNSFCVGSLLFTYLLLLVEFLSNWSQEFFCSWIIDLRCFHPNESWVLLTGGCRHEKRASGTVDPGDRRFLQGLKQTNKQNLLNWLIVYNNSSLMEKRARGL